MEAFFERGSGLRLWASGDAAATQLAITQTWPPIIAAAGLAPCVRAWTPSSEVKTEFEPVAELREADGPRFVSVAMQDELMIAADASPSGHIFLWDVHSWRRVQALEAGAEISCLSVCSNHIAAGTVSGYVRVWRRAGAGKEFLPLFDPDLQLDGKPLYNVRLGPAPDGSCMLVVHSLGKNRIGVWRLTNGKLVHTLGLPGTPGDAAAAAAANVMYSFLVGNVLALVSWAQGSSPVVQLLDVLSRQGSVLEAPDRLAGRPRPLSADFDGSTLVVGFQDGALCAFGFKGWIRFLPGAVGAVRLLPERQQLLCGCADNTIRLWSLAGTQLAQLDLGFQPVTIAAFDVGAVVGSHTGDVQIVTLGAAPENVEEAEDEQAGGSSSSSSSSAGVASGLTPSRSPHANVAQYDLHFDARGVLSDPSAFGPARLRQHSYEKFVRPRVFVTAAEVAEASATSAAAALGKEAESIAMPAIPLPVSMSPGEEEAALAAARQQAQRKMGEETGVARGAAVELSSSSASMGQRCSNPTCLVRERLGAAVFRRCGACKQRRYCSAHCQRTHWRDGHSKECAQLLARGPMQG
ncbi:MAG: hypothetical protein WDW38_004240 [Sanguina aurantia]